MSVSRSRWILLGTMGCLVASCALQSAEEGAGTAAAPGQLPRPVSGSSMGAQGSVIPAGAQDAQARLATSPRHAEWAMIPAGRDSIRAFVVFPERSTPAPVIIVVHEIFGLSHWVRAVADQLAADGFIAVAPDFLTTKNLPGAPADTPPDAARAAIQTVEQADVQRWIDAAARWGMAHPAALDRYGIVGYCWGGAVSFNHAVHAPGLGASVVYYGPSPPTDRLATIRAPVLGLYGENDARVNATVHPADSAMRALGKAFEHHTFAGAGHGFLRAQDGANGANLAATREAWPRTVHWFRRHLELR
ncbi:MAG TPA: dienelactone hydrolase family protein [Gemmatimonadaceae bacterium]|nr:dienelactone hydrolase family protein [Gemmatimonadaceae bacterium]